MTPAEKAHIARTKYFAGCLPCLLKGWDNCHADYHHHVEGYRRGHLFGFGMCLWHHRGDLDVFWTLPRDQVIERIGPSFALDKRGFTEMFGTEEQLVALNEYALELWEAEEWLSFDMPYHVSEKIRQRHRQHALFAE